MSNLQPLPREEYIEQEYFFRVYRERLQQNMPSQDILKTVHEEILATTRLPMAVDFMRAEILHSGRMSDAMARLKHYFTPFQTFVVDRAEDDVSKFEQITAFEILEREAGYRASGASRRGLFVYQFECVTRNRLGFTDGLHAMASDPFYDERWSKWIRSLHNQLGVAELSELVYRASENYQTRRKSQSTSDQQEAAAETTTLFGEQDGRIAKANIGRDPLYFFAALQRQLNYPKVPLSKKLFDEKLSPFLEARLSKIEQRLKIAEMELKGGNRPDSLLQNARRQRHAEILRRRGFAGAMKPDLLSIGSGYKSTTGLVRFGLFRQSPRSSDLPFTTNWAGIVSNWHW